MAVRLISHVISDVGKIRSSNQDSAYAGENLFFVADGMGGHAGGDIASALVTQYVAKSDVAPVTTDEAEERLGSAILEANRLLGETVRTHPELAGMGTTYSGAVFRGNDVVIAHIGDSRAYLMRGSKVVQLTTDHTFVQRLVETGRITEEEALVHPRRNVLMRVLGDVDENPEIDFARFETKAGDRWLFCSDGLSGVVPDELIEGILTSNTDTEEAATLLVGEALEFGAPDNVTVVLVDVVGANSKVPAGPSPVFAGSAAAEVVIQERKGKSFLALLSPKSLAELLRKGEETTEFAPESEEYLEKILRQTRSRIRARRIRQLATVILLLLASLLVLGIGYAYTQTRYYVAIDNGYVAIYKGINESLGPLKFSSVYERSELEVESLPVYQQQLLERSIIAESLSDAERILKQLSLAVPFG